VADLGIDLDRGNTRPGTAMQKAKFRVCSGRDLDHAVGSVASRHNLISCSKSCFEVGRNEVLRCQVCESKQRKGKKGFKEMESGVAISWK
jgi:hypothetical protein